MVLKKGSKWSNWSWDKPVKAFIWRSSRICRPIGGFPPGVFEDSLPHLLLRNNSIVKSYEQGYASYQQGKYYEALASYERSLTFARQARFPQNVAANLTSMGFIYGLLGHY